MFPQGLTLEEAAELRKRDPEEYVRALDASMVMHVDAMLALQRAGAVAFDYGNNIRAVCVRCGMRGCVSDSRASCPSTSVRCSVRARGRSGGWRCRAIRKTSIATDELALELFPDNEILTRWLRLARGRFAFQGLPARICWLGYGERARMGEAINDLVRKGEDLSADRDRPRPSRHRLGGQPLSRNGEDAGRIGCGCRLADAQRAVEHGVAARRGCSFHHGGGVGMGYSLHAGQVTVADGTEKLRERIARVLNNDPGIGVARHADAGYELAQQTAREKGIQIPMAGKYGMARSIAVVNIGQLVTLAGPARPRIGAELRSSRSSTMPRSWSRRAHHRCGLAWDILHKVTPDMRWSMRSATASRRDSSMRTRTWSSPAIAPTNLRSASQAQRIRRSPQPAEASSAP